MGTKTKVHAGMKFTDGGNVRFEALHEIAGAAKKANGKRKNGKHKNGRPKMKLWLVKHFVSGAFTSGPPKLAEMTEEKILQMAEVTLADRAIRDLNTVGKFPPKLDRQKKTYHLRIRHQTPRLRA